MTYLGLLYQDIIRQGAFTPSGKLPPVLPVVLYNGERRWSAAHNVADLVEDVPGGLSRYRPALSYLLLDEGAIVDAPGWSDEMRNAVAAIFRIEKHRGEQDVVDAIQHLAEWLKGPEQAGLRRAIIVWLYRVFLPNRAPGLEFTALNDATNLHEVHDMLSERIKKWPERWLEEGRQEGRHEGVEGMLRKQIALKFGELPDWADKRLTLASDAQLDEWVTRILLVETLDALLVDE